MNAKLKSRNLQLIYDLHYDLVQITCLLFSFKRRMLKAYRTHKISGMKALCTPLFLLFIRLGIIHGLWFTYYIGKVSSKTLRLQQMYLAGQLLKMICFWNAILESRDNNWSAWTPAVFFFSSLQFLFGIHIIQRQVTGFPLFSNLSRTNALITETMDSKIRLIVSW